MDEEQSQSDNMLSARINAWREKETKMIETQMKFQHDIQTQMKEIGRLSRELDKRELAVHDLGNKLEQREDTIADL